MSNDWMKWDCKFWKTLTTVFALIALYRGIASQYAPGVMERTIRVRQAGLTAYDLPEHLPEVDGYAAHPLPEMIGEIVWARPLGDDRWYSILIVDTANPSDGGLAFQAYGVSRPLSAAEARRIYDAIRSGDLIPKIPLEIDYNLAERWGTVGKGIKIEIAYEVRPDRFQEGVGQRWGRVGRPVPLLRWGGPLRHLSAPVPL